MLSLKIKFYSMIRTAFKFILAFTAFTVSSPVLFGQQNNSTNSPSALEIVQWLNNFENAHSPEQIMEGTFSDKVNVSIQDSILTINSMIFEGLSNSPTKIREIFNLKDVKRIEALEKVKDEYVIVEYFIHFEPGKILLECKKENQANFYKCSFADSFYEKYGYTSSNLRFKFTKDKSEEYTQKVYNALETLAKMKGANPKIGSLF